MMTFSSFLSGDIHTKKTMLIAQTFLSFFFITLYMLVIESKVITMCVFFILFELTLFRRTKVVKMVKQSVIW